MTPHQPKPVAAHWAEQVEKVRSLDQDGIRVVLWDAESADQDHETVAAGILHLPDTGYSLERLAYALRDTLQEVIGDPSISVTTCERDDDGAGDAAAWARRGVAEFYVTSPYIADPWHDERDPEDDEDQEDADYVDPEVINELESIERENRGDEDQDDERPELFPGMTWSEPKPVSPYVAGLEVEARRGGDEGQADEYEEPSEEEMAAEVSEIMRESLEAAGDIRHFPDGSRWLLLPQPVDEDDRDERQA